MSRVVWRAFADFEKEEAWINEQAAKGLAFTRYRLFRYTLEPCTPGEYIYQIQHVRDRRSQPDYANFVQYVESTGAKVVCRHKDWLFLRKKTAEGPFNLLRNIDSLLAHYRQLMSTWLILCILQFVLAAGYVYLQVFSMRQGEGWDWYYAILGAIWLATGVLVLIQRVRYQRKSAKLEKERALHE